MDSSLKIPLSHGSIRTDMDVIVKDNSFAAGCDDGWRRARVLHVPGEKPRNYGRVLPADRFFVREVDTEKSLILRSNRIYPTPDNLGKWCFFSRFFTVFSMSWQKFAKKGCSSNGSHRKIPRWFCVQHQNNPPKKGQSVRMRGGRSRPDWGSEENQLWRGVRSKRGRFAACVYQPKPRAVQEGFIRYRKFGEGSILNQTLSWLKLSPWWENAGKFLP